MGILKESRRLRVREPVEMSATLAINTRVGELITAGHRVFHLGFGEARFPLHPTILDAMREHADARSYLPVAGLPELRRAIASHYAATFDLEVDASQVLVGAGSKSLLFAAVAALDGDVILPSPCWVSYDAQVRLAGRRILAAPTSADDDYRLTPEILTRTVASARAAGASPAGVILNSPNNPTGVVLSRPELAALAETARAEGLIVISDEIYALTAFGEEPHASMAAVYPEGTIVTSGLSKHLSLGGWRLGLALVPRGETGERLRNCMTGVAGCIWTCAAAPVQHAAVAAYREDPAIEAFVAACAVINGRVTMHLWEVLRRLGVPCPRPAGGFYLYPSFAPWSEALSKHHGVGGSPELARMLLEQARIASLPGTDFGSDPAALTLRFSTSFLHDLADKTPDEVIEIAREPPSDELLRRICPDALAVGEHLSDFVRDLYDKRAGGESG